MGSNLVVLPPPTLDQNFGLQQCVEDLDVQQLISELFIETLDVAIHPGAARFDVKRPDTHSSQPLSKWGVGHDNKGLRYNLSEDDGQTWNGETITLLPETNIAARYYSACTLQLDDQHVGTVFTNNTGIYFLKVAIDRLA